MNFARLYPAVSIILIFVLSGMFPDLFVQNPPLYFSMAEEWSRVEGEEYIGIFKNPDTILEHELYLLSDETGNPLFFHSDVTTPVCIDGICKPVSIELYWNLIGHYIGYGIKPREPLTKYDHDEFVEADYEKLHRLLSDNKSVLRRKKLSELFDENAEPEKKVEYKGEEVDAVSGATKKEIKESVIEGALYSCYRLWHLVHGDVTDKIEAYLQTIYSEELERDFLFSGYEDYHFYALKQMSGTDFEAHLSRIVDIFRSDKPLTRTYILKKIPKAYVGREAVSRGLYGAFSAVDINSRTLLVEHLPHAHPVASELLSTQVSEMSKNQLEAYLKFLVEDESRLNPDILKNLKKVADSNEYAYGYLIERYLE